MDNQPAQPVFDPSAPHHQRPKLRPVRGFPAKHGEMTLIGLADARQISDQIVFAAPGFQMVLPHFDGQKDIDSIIAAVGRGLTRDVLEQFVARLDEAGLLEGPTFEAMLVRMRRTFDEAPTLPPATTAAFADQLVMQEFGEQATDEQKLEHGARKLRATLDEWMNKSLESAPDPSFNTLPRAVVAPHLDYWRGWINYGHVYGRMRVTDRPDRVIILGTNHFGTGTGVVGCDKSYETPLGLCRLDTDFLDKLKANLGPDNAKKLLSDRYDHEREHSIELHIPWIQHVFGDGDNGGPKVFAALVHDPLAKNGQSYDGQGLDLDPFVAALKKTIAESPGRTLIVASVDLSHVGSSFGDQTPIAGETDDAKAFRDRVINHDREMLTLLSQGKLEEMLTAMAWQQNPTRWCSIGALTATMRATEAKEIQVFQYAAAGDQQGLALVSSFSGAIH